MHYFSFLTLIAAPIALLIDRLLGEPKKFHPLIGFGKIANSIEVKMNNVSYLFISGVFAWLLAIAPIAILALLAQTYLSSFFNFVFTVLLKWLAIAWKSLEEHGLAVSNAFTNNDLEEARLKTSYLVSRDTSELDESALSRATIESVLENGNDAIFASLFWLIVLGPFGIVLYRLSNTLDAMWGYRNERFEYFGKFSARVDDVLNYIPARFCALLYALCGDTKQALTAWQTQANNWYSPNAGVVMATGAGALNLRLGGSAIYHGSLKERPDLGRGKEAQAIDIQRAVSLLNNSVFLLMVIMIITAVSIYVFA